jgi:hypothetical protein
MNEPQLLALISQAVNWAFLIVLMGGPALVIVVTARRPADDRDAFMRNLPHHHNRWPFGRPTCVLNCGKQPRST